MLAAIVTAFGYGLRHGADLDHLAAITDITSSQDDGKRSMALAGLYAAGHAVVVFVLGVLAIAAGDLVPAGLDEAMGRVVGATLIALGLYVFWSLARHGRDVRLRSRWMLVFDGLRRLRRRVTIEHDHDHPPDHHPTPHSVNDSSRIGGAIVHKRVAVKVKHSHRHRHVGEVPVDPFTGYGARTAFGVGMLHGVGAETPTQVLLFVAAAGVAGTGGGVLMLVAFVVGLVLTNTVIALASTFGFLRVGRNNTAFAMIAGFTGAASLVLGTLYVLGRA